MTIIDTHPSRQARWAVVLLWASGMLLLAMQDRQWDWLIQMLWTIGLLLAARNTFGLNSRPLRLSLDNRGWQLTTNGSTRPLTRIHAGVVGPRLIAARLYTPEGACAILVPADSTSAEQHWQLRRLVLAGC